MVSLKNPTDFLGDKMCIKLHTGYVDKAIDADIKFPEAYLHPNEEVSFCEKLAKGIKKTGQNQDVNISTFSPVVVHALDVFCRKYYVDIKFFLHEDGKIYEVEEDDLYIIFQNLGKCYDKIDDVEIELMFR